MRPNPIENIHVVISHHCWQSSDGYASLFPSLRLFSTYSLLFLVKRYKSTLAPPKLSVSASLSEEVPPSYKAALRIYNSCQRTLASQCSTMLHNSPQTMLHNAPQCSTMVQCANRFWSETERDHLAPSLFLAQGWHKCVKARNPACSVNCLRGRFYLA